MHLFIRSKIIAVMIIENGRRYHGMIQGSIKNALACCIIGLNIYFTQFCFQAASAAARTFSKFQPGISVAIFCKAFSVLTGDIPL